MTDQNLPTIATVVQNIITPRQKTLTDALGGRMGWEPWCAAVVNDLRHNPTLVAAAHNDQTGFIAALSVAASCGLVPGSAHGHFYLVPFGGKVQGIMGYKGMCEMAYRHPRVLKIHAALVFDGEEYSFDLAEGAVAHKWNPNAKRTVDGVVCAYSQVTLGLPSGMAGGEQKSLFVLTREELLDAKKRSKASKGPWVEFPLQQMRKTAIRRHMNSGMVPRSADMLILMAHLDREDEDDEKPPVVKAEGEPMPASGVERLKVRVEEVTGFDPAQDADLVGGGDA